MPSNLVKRLLLISSSTVHGSGYLDHAASEIQDFLGIIKRVLFVPFAMHDRDGYAAQAKKRFAEMGFELESIHTAEDPVRTVKLAEAIFIGGGNTFRLLKSLYDLDLVLTIRTEVEEGLPYIGSSAGSNVASPTIKTTNDMPIVEPASFEAFNFVSFQINPHYQDSDPSSTHMGETREERLRQYLEENPTPVVGLREGTMLRVENGKTLLKGNTSARVFRQGVEALEVPPGRTIDEFVNS